MHESNPDDDSGPDESINSVDYDVLERIGGRLRGANQFSRVEFRPPHAPSSVIGAYDLGYFPAGVERAYLRIRWFQTDDFNVHYSEQYGAEGDWECRWDRHPNGHNTRDHFHPPPDASTPGEDEDFPSDWRAVMSMTLRVLDERIQSFWE